MSSNPLIQYIFSARHAVENMSNEMDGAVVCILLQIFDDVEHLRSISRHHYVSEECSSKNLELLQYHFTVRGLEQGELTHSLCVS